MKAKKKELRVDYIGGQGSLTLAEEEAITQYLNKSKGGSKKGAKQQFCTSSDRTDEMLF